LRIFLMSAGGHRLAGRWLTPTHGLLLGGIVSTVKERVLNGALEPDVRSYRIRLSDWLHPRPTAGRHCARASCIETPAGTVASPALWQSRAKRGARDAALVRWGESGKPARMMGTGRFPARSVTGSRKRLTGTSVTSDDAQHASRERRIRTRRQRDLRAARSVGSTPVRGS
jgi:hypothetical protein